MRHDKSDCKNHGYLRSENNLSYFNSQVNMFRSLVYLSRVHGNGAPVYFRMIIQCLILECNKSSTCIGSGTNNSLDPRFSLAQPGIEVEQTSGAIDLYHLQLTFMLHFHGEKFVSRQVATYLYSLIKGVPPPLPGSLLTCFHAHPSARSINLVIMRGLLIAQFLSLLYCNSGKVFLTTRRLSTSYLVCCNL